MDPADVEVDAEAAVREYYAAIDAGDYDRLAELLRPEFTHDRPDRTLEGRGRFVRFMREERPMTDTDHVVEAVYAKDSGVAVQGRLLDAAGDPIFAFVDVFGFEDGTIATLETYID